MPCHPSHTHGPGVDDYPPSEGERNFAEDAERAQQEADHRRDVERDREMVTEDPEWDKAAEARAATYGPPFPDADGNAPEPPAGLGLPYVRGVEHLQVLNYSYWNANGKGVCIAAVEGSAADWAAYIGADDGQRTEECVEWTIRRGCKLSRQQAHRWFPDLPIEAYRE